MAYSRHTSRIPTRIIRITRPCGETAYLDNLYCPSYPVLSSLSDSHYSLIHLVANLDKSIHIPIRLPTILFYPIY